MKAEAYLNKVIFTINTHDLIGVPSEESIDKFMDSIWSHDFGDWKIFGSEKTHYEVINVSFNNEDEQYEQLGKVKKQLLELAEEHLNKL